LSLSLVDWWIVACGWNL